jgi:hypothetical protein
MFCARKHKHAEEKTEAGGLVLQSNTADLLS